MTDVFQAIGIIAIYWASVLAVSYFLKGKVKGLQINPLMIIYKKEAAFKRLEHLAGRKWVRAALLLGVVLTFVSVSLFYYTIFGVVSSRFASSQSSEGLVPIIPGITITGVTIIYVLFSLGISAAVHELSHAVASKALGVPIKSVGFIVSLFIPAAFVEPDEESFNSASRLKKIQILSAGPASNLILGFSFLFILSSVAVTMPGALITSVDQGYPAQQSGLSSGLVIIAINGTTISTPTDLSPFIARYSNSSVTFNLTIYDPKTNMTYWKDVYKPANFSRIGVTLEQARGPSPLPDSIYFPVVNILFYLYLINVSLAIINAAPIFITDGGKIINEIIAWKLKGNAGKVVNFFIQVFTLLLILSSITFTPI
jgi:membrane-associated protease RseP (regulator of RpoE activity)